MPICPKWRTGYDQEEACPTCGSARPEPLPVVPVSAVAAKPPYGAFSVFCLLCAQIGTLIACIFNFYLFVRYVWEGSAAAALMMFFILPATIGWLIALRVVAGIVAKENARAGRRR